MGWLQRLSSRQRQGTGSVGRHLLRAHEAKFKTLWLAADKKHHNLEVATGYHRLACAYVRSNFNLSPQLELWLSSEALPNVAAITGLHLEELMADEVARIENFPEHTRRYYGLDEPLS